MNRMSREVSYCACCGRVTHRCRCLEEDGATLAFFERGGRAYQPLTRSEPYKRGVPPQIKRRERAMLRANYGAWYQQLVAARGECCANCGEKEDLVLDHIVPLAKGGGSQLDNLQLLCATCNRIKGKLVIDCRAFGHKD